MIRSFSKLTLASLILILGTIQVGCDDGTYSKRYGQRLESITRVSGLSTQLGERYRITDPSGTSVNMDVQFPKVFYAAEGQTVTVMNANDQPPRAPDKMQIPGIPINGFSYSFESLVNSGKGNLWAFNAYTYAVPVGDLSNEQFEDSIVTALKTKITSDVRWTPYEYVDFDGVTQKVSQMVILSGLPFNTKTGEIEELKTLEGRMEMYHINTGTHHVVLCYRGPSELISLNGFDSQIKASVASTKIY